MFGTIHTPLRVLLLDAHHPQALAMVRSLGRRRTWVTVASHEPYTPAQLSRYCADSLRCPPPQAGPADFRRWLFATLRRERFDTLLFCCARTAEILAAHGNTIRLYSRCALPQPHLLHDLARPGGGTLLTQVNLEGRLQAAVPFTSSAHRDYSMITLARRGEPVAVFLHRLEESSAHDTFPWHQRRALESIEHDGIRQLGLGLLREIGWDGVATLGFRHDEEKNTLSLLGLHPAWGDGLELAMACGVDLPWLYAQLAAGHPITGPTRYHLGWKYQRLLVPAPRSSLKARLLGLAAACSPDVRTDLFVRDPLPHLPILGRLALWLRRKKRSRWQAAPRKPPKLELLPGGRRPAASQLSSSIPTRAGGTSP